MKISLIQADGKLPNLALWKLKKYHEQRGDEVAWNNELYSSIADKTYVSAIFTWTDVSQWKGLPNTEIGGTGYDSTISLPEEIEAINPHINVGFTTRGCIRNCPFCFVPKKEGKIRAVGDLMDLWDMKGKVITLMDNNILALPEHFFMICKQSRDMGVRIDFNQGLDHRLLTDEMARAMFITRHYHEWRFAYDSPKSAGTVDRALDILQSNGIKKCFWYVLIGYDTTHEQDMERLVHLRERGQTPYVMVYNWGERKYDPWFSALSTWTKCQAMFKKKDWDSFLMEIKSVKPKLYKDLMASTKPPTQEGGQADV